MVDFKSLYPNFLTDIGTFYIMNKGFVIIAVVDI